MPDKVETAAAPAPGAPGPESPGAADAGAVSYDGQWLQKLDPRRMVDVNAWAEHYHKTKAGPIESELHGLRSEVGKLKKAADPDTLALMEDHDTMLEAMKESAMNFPGVVKEDVEGLKTARELQMFLRGMAKGRPAAGAAGAEVTSETAQAWKEFLASRQKGAGTKQEAEREPLLGGGAGAPVSDGEAFLKELGMDGEIAVEPGKAQAALAALRNSRRYG
jgi:hypothetical protein